ncbi:MAG: hypothetical protein ABIJ21_05160 [Nanoarchaeota archaeon]
MKLNFHTIFVAFLTLYPLICLFPAYRKGVNKVWAVYQEGKIEREAVDKIARTIEWKVTKMLLWMVPAYALLCSVPKFILLLIIFHFAMVFIILPRNSRLIRDVLPDELVKKKGKGI